MDYGCWSINEIGYFQIPSLPLFIFWNGLAISILFSEINTFNGLTSRYVYYKVSYAIVVFQENIKSYAIVCNVNNPKKLCKS